MLRDEILHTARRLVATKGHIAMSMDELAAQVGISKPTLYSFFPTKEALVVAAVVEAMQRIGTLLEYDQDDCTPLQRLTLLLRTAIQLRIDETGELPRTWTPDLSHLLSEHQYARDCLNRIDTSVVALIQAGKAQGEIDPDLDPAIIVWTMYALLGMPYLAHLSSSGTPNPVCVAPMLATIFARGIQGPQRHV
jgi:AcrR family transcriptional regulator